MQEPPSSDSNHRASPGWLYWLTFGLTGALMVYALAWGAIIAAIIGWNARITVFGADIYNALQSATRFDIVLIGLVIAAASASFILTAFRSGWAAVGMTAMAAFHLVLWIRLIANPYYSASPGYLLIPLEIVGIVLMLLLVRRGVLR